MNNAEHFEILKTFLAMVGFFALIHFLITELRQEFKEFKIPVPTPPQAESLNDAQFIFKNESMLITDDDDGDDKTESPNAPRSSFRNPSRISF